MELSKQAYELCRVQNAQGLRAFLETHSADIDLYLHEEEVTDPDGTPIAVNIMGLAAHHESPECLQVLLDFGVDVNNQDRDKGRTLLMCAATFGRVECMRLLLEKSADVAVTDNDGRMALPKAASFGHPQCVQLLLEANADVDQVDEDGSTGLIWACLEGHLECLRLLIENKADMDCKDKYGDTGLILAAYFGHPECAKVMMEAKADVNIRGMNRDTALTAAFKQNRFNCLMVLLDHGGGGIPASAHTKAHALGCVLKREEESASVVFMLLAHGADFKAHLLMHINPEHVQLATSMYGHINRFIDRWHGVASNALSLRVKVDRRVGLGLDGLYQEPLERVLQYLGLSMEADQVVNGSLDDDDRDFRRVLLPNCAHNANHWFQLYQQRKKRLAAAHAKPAPSP
jgi:ankyrin repeat protein